MKSYFVSYNTGAGDFTVPYEESNKSQSLSIAMGKADEGACYTQQDIDIYNDEDVLVAKRKWWGVQYEEENEELRCDNPIIFGTFGYYDDWTLY